MAYTRLVKNLGNKILTTRIASLLRRVVSPILLYDFINTLATIYSRGREILDIIEIVNYTILIKA